MTRGGFFDPDYARDKSISDLRRRVTALEQRLADLEAKAGTTDRLDPPREDQVPSSREPQ